MSFHLQLALLPVIYCALNTFLLVTDYDLESVNIPLILLSHFNVIVLSFILVKNHSNLSRFAFALTPLIYCIFYLVALVYYRGEIREFEPSDSYVYDYLASLLSRTDGLNLALQTKYSYDDFGYPFIKYIFSAYDGSNFGLFIFKLTLHYVTSYMLIHLARVYTSAENASKAGLFYLNTSVALLFVMSGLKETIFAFITILSLLVLHRSFFLGVLISGMTYFFRKVYPMLILSSYFILNKKIGPKVRIFFGTLFFFLVFYLYVNTEFFTTYSIVFFHYYDEILILASMVSGLLGGLVTIDVGDVTNYVYSPTVFIVNFLMIQAIVVAGLKLFNDKSFWLIMIFSIPLIVLMQAIKVRYLAPFYGLYIIHAVSFIEHKSNFKFIISLVIFVTLSISWNILSN
jgi:hypothetical protein